MTRKHFIELAEIANRMRTQGTPMRDVVKLVTELADMGARHNANFDRARFFDACGFSLHGSPLNSEDV